MKFKKLAVMLSAAALIAPVGATVVSSNASTVVQAARTKASANAYVAVRRNAIAYRITFNKTDTKIIRIAPAKTKNGKHYLRLKSGRTRAYWSYRYKRVTYYYIGGRYAVRAKDAKRVGSKRVPTLTSIMKANQAKLNAAKAKLTAWQNKISAAMPKPVAGKTNTASVYWVMSQDGKTFSKAGSELPAGSQIEILFKDDAMLTSSNGSTQAAYFAEYNGSKIIVPAAVVTLDQANAAVPTMQEYANAIQNANNLYNQAKQDLSSSVR